MLNNALQHILAYTYFSKLGAADRNFIYFYEEYKLQTNGWIPPHDKIFPHDENDFY